MAGEDRTEKATPKRRQEARKKGQVARSQDLNAALVLLAGIMTVALLGSHIANTAGNCMRTMLADIAHPDTVMTAAGMKGLFTTTLMTLALTVGPVAGACFVAAALGGIAQLGGRPQVHGLKFDFKRISPLSGAKNIFGPNAFFETGKALAKVGAVAAVAALTLLPDMTGLASKVGIPPLALGALSGKAAISVAERAGFAYLLIGLIDYAWSKRRHERQLRMTKQEVKEEARQHTVSNEVKQALRRRQMQAARARMMAAVPEADVVVTNPTHYAVALKYDGSKPAPEVIAKGQDLIAAQIRKVAGEHDVPIVPDPPLARALHASVEIGQTIPAELYIAVARVLAYVYRVAGRTRAAAAGGAL
ncbi:MAG TPA: EscU/YscU/HrcU family type III secretion system export apparatus switch protein [Solirubrobacteraceae bacterium]|jgi:flagellar biosynthetic protein FlhB